MLFKHRWMWAGSDTEKDQAIDSVMQFIASLYEDQEVIDDIRITGTTLEAHYCNAEPEVWVDKGELPQADTSGFISEISLSADGYLSYKTPATGGNWQLGGKANAVVETETVILSTPSGGGWLQDRIQYIGQESKLRMYIYPNLQTLEWIDEFTVRSQKDGGGTLQAESPINPVQYVRAESDGEIYQKRYKEPSEELVGDLNTILSASAIDLPHGDPASADYNPSTGEIVLGIPAGANGADGANGLDAPVPIFEFTPDDRLRIDANDDGFWDYTSGTLKGADGDCECDPVQFFLPEVSDMAKLCYVADVMATRWADDFQDFVEGLDFASTFVQTTFGQLITAGVNLFPGGIDDVLIEQPLNIQYLATQEALEQLASRAFDIEVRGAMREIIYCSLVDSLNNEGDFRYTQRYIVIKAALYVPATFRKFYETPDMDLLDGLIAISVLTDAAIAGFIAIFASALTSGYGGLIGASDTWGLLVSELGQSAAFFEDRGCINYDCEINPTTIWIYDFLDGKALDGQGNPYPRLLSPNGIHNAFYDSDDDWIKAVPSGSDFVANGVMYLPAGAGITRVDVSGFLEGDIDIGIWLSDERDNLVNEVALKTFSATGYLPSSTSGIEWTGTLRESTGQYLHVIWKSSLINGAEIKNWWIEGYNIHPTALDDWRLDFLDGKALDGQGSPEPAILKVGVDGIWNAGNDWITTEQNGSEYIASAWIRIPSDSELKDIDVVFGTPTAGNPAFMKVAKYDGFEGNHIEDLATLTDSLSNVNNISWSGNELGEFWLYFEVKVGVEDTATINSIAIVGDGTPPESDEWQHTIDLTATEVGAGRYYPVEGFVYGAWENGVGWKGVLLGGAERLHWILDTQLDQEITYVSIKLKSKIGQVSPNTQLGLVTCEGYPTPVGGTVSIFHNHTRIDNEVINEYEWTGSQVIDQFYVVCEVSSGGDGTGYCELSEITLRGTGNNPFN